MKNDVEIRIYEDAATGKREAQLPTGFRFPDTSKRICEMVEGGFSLETVAAQCHVSIQVVSETLESREAEIYRNYLVVQRQLESEGRADWYKEMKQRCLDRIAKMIDDSDDKAFLTIFKEIMDRDPDQEFVKTNREVREYSGNVNFNVGQETKRVGSINAKYKALPVS